MFMLVRQGTLHRESMDGPSFATVSSDSNEKVIYVGHCFLLDFDYRHRRERAGYLRL